MPRKLFILSILFLIFSCSGKQANSQKNIISDANSETDISSIPQDVLDRGEEVYKSYCLACHQSDGSGNPGMYPPLVKTKTVKGDKEKLIDITLNGLQGEIEVKGEIYDQVMVPHDFLSNQEIADVLTYIRNSFGNDYSPVSPEEVAKMREDAK